MTGLLNEVPVKKVKQAKKAKTVNQRQPYRQRAQPLLRPTPVRQHPRGLLS